MGICVKVDNSFGVVTPRGNHLMCCTCKPDSCCHTRKLEKLLESDHEDVILSKLADILKRPLPRTENYVCHSYSRISFDAVGLQAVLSTPHIHRFGLEHGRFDIKSHETVCSQCHVELEEKQEEAVLILPNQIIQGTGKITCQSVHACFTIILTSDYRIFNHILPL